MLAGLAGLSPAYFGMVMATGIVSLAAHLLAMPGIAQALFRLNIVVYAVLWFLTLLRMARYPQRFFGDMVDHLRGPGFFTTVAGTSVLGSQFVVLAADYRAGAVLWVVAIMRMYSASTREMIEAMGFDFLGFLPPVFLYTGLAAWMAAFAGLAFDLVRRVGAFRS